MPYDPGIRNISGELLAQGQMRQAEGIAGGLVNWLKGYEQNQSLKKQGMSTFTGILANNPELQQFMQDAESGGKQVPPEVLKAFANYKKGDVDVYDASMLGNFASNFLTSKREAQAQQYNQLQQTHIGLQNQLLGQQVEEAKRAADFWKSLPADQTSTGTTQPAAGAAPAVNAPSYGIPAVALGRFAQGTEMAPAAAAAGQAPAGVPTSRPSGQVTQADVLQAALASRGSPIRPTAAQLMMNARTAAAQKVKEFEASSLHQGPTAQQDAQAEIENLNKTNPLPDRQTRKLKYFPEARGWSFEVTERPPTAQEKADEAAAIENATSSVKEAKTFLSDLEKRGTEASNSIVNNLEVKRLLKSGTETGPLEGFKADAISYASKFGLANKDQIAQANDFNKIKALMMEDQIKFAQESTRGNLNTYEQKMLASAKANAENKLAGANEYLNDMVIAAKMKEADSIAEEKRVRELIPDERKRARYLKDWINDSKNSLLNYMNRIGAEQQPSGVPSLAPAAGGAAPSGGQSQYITGATYKNKRNEEFIWDGTKMVPKK